MFLNAQSVRNKTTDICDHVMHANVDLIFLCETWLRPEGDESDCVALTPPGFCLRSFPRMSGAGGGLAVLYRNSLTKNIAVSTRDYVFTAFEICEVRISLDSHTVVFLSVYRPPPRRKNKLTNAMFLEQFADLLESYVACDRFFVVHFDNPSDPCTAALNAVLANLSLEQLVNVPTHRRGHTLDWLITNRVTDVLDLAVADILLSDHFIISFDLLLRKPGRVTKKVTSRNIRSVDMYAFRTDLRNVLECATQSESADPLSVYKTCLRQALDHHAPLVTRTVTDRTSAPWMTLEVKQAKVERRIAECKWRQSGLTVHREIYAKQHNVVSNLISQAKKDYICEKIIDCDSSREIFRLSNQLMAHSEVLSCQSLFLISLGMCHCAPVLLCPRPIVPPSHCAPVPLCPWTVKKLLRFRAEVSDFGIFGSIFKTAASFVLVFCLFVFYLYLKQCSIANFFV